MDGTQSHSCGIFTGLGNIHVHASLSLIQDERL